MKKSKSITLLTIVCIILAAALVMTFIRFSFGVYEYNSIFGAVNYDYDVEGGVSYTLTLSEDNEEEVDDINEVLKTIKSRLNELGHTGSKVEAVKKADQAVTDYDIRIEARATSSIESDIHTVAAYGTVKFYGGEEENPTTEIMNKKKAVKSARYLGQGTTYDNNYQQQTVYGIAIDFTDYGYEALVEAIDSVSSEDSQKTFYFKIMLDENQLYSGTLQKDNLSGKTFQLSSTNEASAKQFALQMNTGGLAYRYDVSSADSVSPMFSENTKLVFYLSIAVMFVAFIVVMAVLYRGYGLISALSLLTFVVAEIGLLVAVPGIYVSFGGLLGILLASVFVIDGLSIFARRYSEEFATGKTVKAGLKIGFNRAFRPILNSNVIAGAIALMLFIFTKGAIQSFAITFGIGVCVSFITSVLIAPMFTFLILPILKNKEGFFNAKKEEN